MDAYPPSPPPPPPTDATSALPLREWIPLALSSADASDDPLSPIPLSAFGVDPRNLALSSDLYLRAALRVARSLAEQLCRGGQGDGSEHREEGDVSGGSPCDGSRRGSSPDWTDRAVVHLHPSNGDNPQRASFSMAENGGGCPPYLAVARAELLPPHKKNGSEIQVADILPTSQNHKSSEVQLISSLGLVFYELFSGGDKPRPDPNNQGRPAGHCHTIGLTEMLIIDDDASNGRDAELQTKHGDQRLSAEALKFVSQTAILDITDDVGHVDGLWNETSSNERSDDDSGGRESKRRSRGDHHAPSKTPSLSVETLKSKGLPGPLCSLISNMIACAEGGDEGYCNLSDVVDDLRLMTDKPSNFLHDLDVERLSADGLKLNEAIFGREAQLAKLQDSYRRAVFSGERECGFISGMSGTGKSVLAQRLGSYIIERGGLFLQGKFDQTQATPFSAIAAAFGQYCTILASQAETRCSRTVITELKRALGIGAYSLAKVIPNLHEFLGLEAMKEIEEDHGCVDAQRRLRYLMCQFVDVISTFSDTPVTLFIDDVQWADEGSIEMIRQLLVASASPRTKKRFYFLACVRGVDLGEDGATAGPFCDMLSRVFLFGISVTTIKLSCMDEGTLNAMMAEALCLPPRITRPLSNLIHHKTKGNPFFVSQLIASLNKEGLLRLSLSRRRWEWDEEKISSSQLPNDMVSFLASTIGRQPEVVQSALGVLSCFGGKSPGAAALQALETMLQLPLIRPLGVAVSEGFLNKSDGCFVFSHDKIQEAAYQTIEPKDRRLCHFKNGVVLVPLALGTEDDGTLLFIAANQINIAGPAAVQDEEQGLLIASLNLTAGQKAMGKSDYSSAHSYFDHGISFLCENHWRDHYDLSLQLYDNAAACAFAIGDLESLKLLTTQIHSFAKSLEDKLNSHYVLVSALAASSKVQESSIKGITVLSQLGEDFPIDASEQDLNVHLQDVNASLCNVTDEQLLNYKTLTDSKAIMIMKLLAILAHSLQMTKSFSHRIATVKMVKLSLCHGMSSVSPMAFTYYGGLLARLGNVREGYRFVKVALKMINRMGSNEFSGQTIGVGTHILCYVEPIHATLDFFMEGHDVAMRAGDTYNALLNKLFHTLCLFWSSRTNLETVKEGFAKCRQLMKQYNQLTWLTNLSIAETSTLTLVGSEDKIDQSADFTGNRLFGLFHCFQNLYVGYMFHRCDQMISMAESYFSFDKEGFLLYFDSCQTFIVGLASFRIYRKSGLAVWIHRGYRAKLEMKRWSETSEWNFKGKLRLLEAEEHFSKGDFERASACYDDAISISKAHKFINDEALACELAGYCSLEQGKKEVSLNYFLRAHEQYGEWGACAKSNEVFEFVQENFVGPPKAFAPALPDPPSLGEQDMPLAGQYAGIGRAA